MLIRMYRCKDKLDILAISVINQWPTTRLRVIESWDEDGEYLHGKNSLHYEGRAVDITTDDRDTSKYGMLARLAVEAGFDWVYYENRDYIHCSVKSDSFHTPHDSGCFTKDSIVLTSNGSTKAMSDLIIGDRVLSVNDHGEPIFSEIILFMDRNLEQTEQFIQLTTEKGAVLTVTPAHLVMIWNPEKMLASYVFADQITRKDQVFVHDFTKALRPERVIKLETVTRKGVVAPLTRAGTIVVNSVAASCYAIVNSQKLAHWSLAPMRLWSSILSYMHPSNQSKETVKEEKRKKRLAVEEYQSGVHWYAKALYTIKDYVLPITWRH
uniref:Protein hedgehog n=1 Tax=Glossina palpalis gambiensis TaxID=67801 RepID=A0A1B0BBC5_9MUSC